MRTQAEADKAVLMVGFARMDVLALSIAVGVVFALLLFVLTATLLITGTAGDPYVGVNLKELAKYFPGYSVTWTGSLVGMGYAGGLGLLAGFCTAVLWNLMHYLYIGLVVIRSLWWRMMAD